jgi:hypothetical protein
MDLIPDAVTIKNMTKVDRFLKEISLELYRLADKSYMSFNFSGISYKDLNDIGKILSDKGYYHNISICGYTNTNVCDQIGCAVYHAPVYEPIKYFNIALEKEKLPKDLPHPSARS